MRKGLFVIMALASSAATAAPPHEEQGDKDKLVCRTEADLGTRLGGTRVCLTREQWAERRRQAREVTEQGQMGHVNRSGG
ncbi:MAG: hypothetical protein ACJ8EB_12640 [Allosphingosinicella sp.]